VVTATAVAIWTTATHIIHPTIALVVGAMKTKIQSGMTVARIMKVIPVAYVEDGVRLLALVSMARAVMTIVNFHQTTRKAT
jgi:hypothetical protein